MLRGSSLLWSTRRAELRSLAAGSGGGVEKRVLLLEGRIISLSDPYFSNTLEVQLSEGFTLKSIASVSLWGMKKRSVEFTLALLYKYVAHAHTHTHAEESSEDGVSQEQLCHTVVVLEHVMNLMCRHVTAFSEQPALGRRGGRRVVGGLEGRWWGRRRRRRLSKTAENKKSQVFFAISSPEGLSGSLSPPHFENGFFFCLFVCVVFLFAVCFCSFVKFNSEDALLSFFNVRLALVLQL